jgi:hypothetical protein
MTEQIMDILEDLGRVLKENVDGLKGVDTILPSAFGGQLPRAILVYSPSEVIEGEAGTEKIIHQVSVQVVLAPYANFGTVRERAAPYINAVKEAIRDKVTISGRVSAANIIQQSIITDLRIGDTIYAAAVVDVTLTEVSSVSYAV